MKPFIHPQPEEVTMREGEETVLSPESHVFVALMSVEEGPNKATMIGAVPVQASQDRAGSLTMH